MAGCAGYVQRMVVMGGSFPSGGEWNIQQDPAAAQIVARDWPTDIVFSGGGIGGDILTGHSLTSKTPVTNPVRRAYEIYVGPNNNRSSWDQTAMLYAVRGGGGLFTLSGPGTAVIENNGDSSFNPSTTGRHRYLAKLVENSQIAAVIEELMVRAPGATPAATAPTIATQPANATVTAPATATFTVAASGSPAPTYQWSSAPSGSTSFTAISGATSASYTTGATSTGMNGTQYRCVATNSTGAATSNAATLTVNAVALRNPENPAGTVAGLTYAYYAVTTDGTIPNLAALTPTATGTVATFDLSPRTREDNFAFAYTGYLSVPTDGVYTLFTSSDDGSRLLVGTTTVVDNDGPHGMQERSGVIGLKAGRHALTVHFAQGAGGFGLEVRWEGPGIAKALVPASALFRPVTGTAPAITTQPANATVTAPATATFTVVASGSPTPTYQWSSAPSGSTTFTAISGATSASYTTGATSTGMNGTRYRCEASNSAGSTTSTAATLTVSGLPTGWSTADSGSVATTGSASVTGGVWTVIGSGADIWDTSDEFRFTSQAVSGDVVVTARVTGLQNTHPWAKAGVMVRETVSATSRHAFTCLTASSGPAFQRRLTTAGSSVHTSGPALSAPGWVRLERVGNLFISSMSTNAATWTEIRRETISMAAAVQVGLAVTSHADGTLCTATFSDVTVVSAPVAVN